METLWISLIVLFAFFAESLFGFGGALMSIPLLSLLMPVRDSVNLVLIFQLLIGVLILKTGRYTNWKVLLYMMPGLLLGSILGTLSLGIASDEALRTILSFAIWIFLIKMIFFGGLKVKGHVQILGFFMGLLGSYVQAVIGSGGPVFTMYLLSAVPDKQEFRATLIFLFFATSIVRLIVSIGTGIIEPATWTYAIPITIPFLILVFLGQRLHWKIPDTSYRYAVYVILFAASISLLLR